MELALQYLDGTREFNGFFVKAKSSQIYLHFRSSEFTWPEYRPKLSFEFETGISVLDEKSTQHEIKFFFNDGKLSVTNQIRMYEVVSLFQLNGRRVFHANIGDCIENSINLKVKSGIYVLQLEGKNMSIQKRVVLP